MKVPPLMVKISRLTAMLAFVMLSTTAAQAQYFNTPKPWDRFIFPLPNNAGTAALEVHNSNKLMDQYNYRLRGECHTYSFYYEPSMQVDGPPNLRLEWIPQVEQDGPYIRLTHDARGYMGSKVEIYDLSTGKTYRDQTLKEGEKKIGRKKRVPIGYLDRASRFSLANGKPVMHEHLSPMTSY